MKFISCQGNMAQDRPHGLENVREGSLVVRPSLKIIVSTVVGEFYLGALTWRNGQNTRICCNNMGDEPFQTLQQENLYLLRHQPVNLELILDLIVA